MKNKTTNIIIIIVFLVVIIIPQLLFFFVKDYMETDNSENRKLATKPEFSFKNITNYFNDLDNYYNDNLPFRGYIRSTYANIIFNIFNESISDNVLVGKNEGDKSSTWLFYKKDTDENLVREAQGVTRYSEQEKLNIEKNITKNIEKLREKNIKLYYTIIPNKENIYKEKLPDNIKIINKDSKTDELVSYLREKNINIIYPREELKEAKNIMQTYWKQDTHWNSYGAFIGFKKIMNEIEPTYNEFDIKLNISEPEVLYKDLTDMLGIKNIFKDNKISVEFLNQIDYNGLEEKTATNVIYITNCDKAKYDDTVIILGDSFRTEMKQYFSKIYKKVICIHMDDYKSDMLEKYKPDIIIFETVERHSKNIENFKIY